MDLLNIHDGCVKCLLWNPDGTMLGKYSFVRSEKSLSKISVSATAGDDNMLNVWNFFGCEELVPVKSNASRKDFSSKLTLPSLLR